MADISNFQRNLLRSAALAIFVLFRPSDIIGLRVRDVDLSDGGTFREVNSPARAPSDVALFIKINCQGSTKGGMGQP